MAHLFLADSGKGWLFLQTLFFMQAKSRQLELQGVKQLASQNYILQFDSLKTFCLSFALEKRQRKIILVWNLVQLNCLKFRSKQWANGLTIYTQFN